MLYCFSAAIGIVLLLSVHDSVGVYCTDSGLCGLFSTPPKKTLIQSRYTHISEWFFASAIAATDKYMSMSMSMSIPGIGTRVLSIALCLPCLFWFSWQKMQIAYVA